MKIAIKLEQISYQDTFSFKPQTPAILPGTLSSLIIQEEFNTICRFFALVEQIEQYQKIQNKRAWKILWKHEMKKRKNLKMSELINNKFKKGE